MLPISMSIYHDFFEMLKITLLFNVLKAASYILKSLI